MKPFRAQLAVDGSEVVVIAVLPGPMMVYVEADGTIDYGNRHDLTAVGYGSDWPLPSSWPGPELPPADPALMSTR